MKAFDSFLRPDETWAGPVADGQLTEVAEVLCPICGFNYNHPGRAQRLLGWEERRGRNVLYKWAGRGNGWSISMDGECGHRWVLNIGFHKGNLYLFTTQEFAPDDLG